MLAILMFLAVPASAFAQSGNEVLATFLSKIREAGVHGVLLGRTITVGEMIKSKDPRLTGGILKFVETDGKINVAFGVQTIRPQAEYTATYSDCHPNMAKLDSTLDCSAENGQTVTMKIMRQTASDVVTFESLLPPLTTTYLCGDAPSKNQICRDDLVLNDQQLQRLDMRSPY